MVGDIQGRLRAYFSRAVGCPLGNLAAELATTEEIVGRHAGSVLTAWEHRVARHCRDAAAAGELAAGVDPAELARRVLVTMQGAILLAKVGNGMPTTIVRTMQLMIDTDLA